MYAQPQFSDDTVFSLENHNVSTTELSDDITIVTAYFNIGRFRKSSGEIFFSPNTYLKWMEVFGRILNPVVAYVDTIESYDVFLQLRAKFGNRSKVILVNRETFWSFGLLPNISRIYAQRGYPKHYPNTVRPEYSCAMHAKFEVLSMSIKKNYFRTKYFSWLDIGLFRNDIGNQTFGLAVPKKFNNTTVAYSSVRKFTATTNLKTIVYSNMVWVSGAFNLGHWDVLLKFCDEYRLFVLSSIRDNLISTDQQMIYGMYVKSSKMKPSVQIQDYSSGWFALGYICRRAYSKHIT